MSVVDPILSLNPDVEIKVNGGIERELKIDVGMTLSVTESVRLNEFVLFVILPEISDSVAIVEVLTSVVEVGATIYVMESVKTIDFVLCADVMFIVLDFVSPTQLGLLVVIAKIIFGLESDMLTGLSSGVDEVAKSVNSVDISIKMPVFVSVSSSVEIMVPNNELDIGISLPMSMRPTTVDMINPLEFNAIGVRNIFFVFDSVVSDVIKLDIVFNVCRTDKSADDCTAETIVDIVELNEGEVCVPGAIKSVFADDNTITIADSFEIKLTSSETGIVEIVDS